MGPDEGKGERKREEGNHVNGAMPCRKMNVTGCNSALISSRTMATGNCRFYAQSEHEFIDHVWEVRLLEPPPSPPSPTILLPFAYCPFWNGTSSNFNDGQTTGPNLLDHVTETSLISDRCNTRYGCDLTNEKSCTDLSSPPPFLREFNTFTLRR
ncbi:hypothetical protein M0804_011909 [Polistes exclamans]|nr:hypothetical protein M0804_011909 [Polistes exclamans]